MPAPKIYIYTDADPSTLNDYVSLWANQKSRNDFKVQVGTNPINIFNYHALVAHYSTPLLDHAPHVLTSILQDPERISDETPFIENAIKKLPWRVCSVMQTRKDDAHIRFLSFALRELYDLGWDMAILYDVEVGDGLHRNLLYHTANKQVILDGSPIDPQLSALRFPYAGKMN